MPLYVQDAAANPDTWHFSTEGAAAAQAAVQKLLDEEAADQKAAGIDRSLASVVNPARSAPSDDTITQDALVRTTTCDSPVASFTDAPETRPGGTSFC